MLKLVSHKLNTKNIKNFGYLQNINVQKLQIHSKFTIASGEDLYIIFTAKCLLHSVKVLIEKNITTKLISSKK